MERLWYVTNDRQGGSFGMNRLYTAEEWLNQAIDWMDSDGVFDDPEEYSEADFIKTWTPIIESNPQEFIDYMSETWELDFAEHGVDGNDYYAEFTQYAAYFNGEWIGDHDELDYAIDAVQKEIDDMIASGNVDSVDFPECYVERFIEDDYDAYDKDPIVYCADGDPDYEDYI